MTDNELIVENNSLIAEFMGLEWRNESAVLKLRFRRGDKFYPFDKLKFHTSWDWLMPVVEKITEMGYDVLINSNGMHNEPHSCDITTTTDVQATTTSEFLIDCVYKAIVEFIKWYNTSTKQ